MAAETPAERPSLEAAARLSWWKLLLVYPAILTSIGGAIPTAWQALKAWRLDVAYSRVQIAEQQQHLWEKNLGCLDLRPVYSVAGPGGVLIGVTLCPSGDALLRYEVGEEVTYTWIPYPTALAPMSQRRAGVAWAQSEPPSPWRSQLLYGASRCTLVRGGLVLRLHTTDGHTCVLEQIHLAAGRVVWRLAVPCTTPCPSLRSLAPSASARPRPPSPSAR